MSWAIYTPVEVIPAIKVSPNAGSADRSGKKGLMNIDEVDFFDQETKSSAFMYLRKSSGGGISIGFTVTANGDLDLAVTVEDAQRLGERLIAAANEVGSKG